MSINLTNLDNLKGWISSPTGSGNSGGDDATLNRLITSASRQIMAYIGRQTFFKNNITNDTYTGNGNTTMLINQWPVITMNSVMVNNTAIPAAQNSSASGWLLEPWDGLSVGRPQKLSLIGYTFQSPVSYGAPYMDGGSPYNSGYTRNQAMNQSPQNVVLNYISGYYVSSEAQTIPASAAYQLTALQLLGTWGQDDGVFFVSNGARLTPVTGTPSTGQYTVTAAGVYTFAAADAGKALLLNYSYIPSDIEQACIEMAGEKYSYKSRIGQRSKSLNGSETAGYNLAGITDSIKMILNPYKSVIFKR